MTILTAAVRTVKVGVEQKGLRCRLVNVIFLTPHKLCACLHQIWSALTGTLLRVYRDVTESDITCICLDDRQVTLATSRTC